MRLSHSGKETYLTCPKKWELHYKERLRSTLIGSALFFGSAVDEALNRMLLDKKKELTDEEKELLPYSPEEIFEKHLKNVRILDETVDISKSLQALYYKSDLDSTLLEAQDYLNIIEHANNFDIELKHAADVALFIEECQLEMKAGLEDSTRSVYNYICWLSLYRKGLMLIDGYRSQIMPQIEEVFEVQKRISLPDEDDELVGVIDLICSFVDEPKVKYVCDNKTSSRAYKDDSVRLSEQLATYSEHEQINKCAYIVVEKKIRKKEPKVRCSIIKDTIPETMIDETFDKLTEVFHGIKEEKFDKDFDACYQYGRKCPYYDNCRTGDLENLKYMKPKDK